MVKEKPKRKGFKRSKKEWEESITTHIGKFVDRFSLDDLITVGVGIWAALHTNNPLATFHGMIGYKLARSEGIPSELAGLGILAEIKDSSYSKDYGG